MNIKFSSIILSCFLFHLFILTAQTRKEKESYLIYYNIEELKNLKELVIQKLQTDRQLFEKRSAQQSLSFRKFNENGTFDEWMGFLPDGTPLYYSINNTDAAASTRTNHLNSGGSLNLNLNGEGMTVGVWDGGPTRISHVEFGERAVVGDGAFNLNNNSFHATHVSGTVGATGINPLAKGMAPNVQLRTFDWNNDLAEVINEAQNGLLLSNHSYGIPVNSVSQQPWFIGAYSQQARAWDQVAYAAPYYLMVTSAGNDGNNTNPEPSTAGYDKLNGNKNAKNNLVIANARDANVDADGNLIFVQINQGSSQGPSDDGRIKPDIAGNGTGLFSTNSPTDTSYTTLTGTSMSGPNVMGTLALLQQYHNQKNGRFMRAATLKGLVCHTADDAGIPGPDPNFGWGLLNAKNAANAITNDGLQSWISEETLKNGETFTMTVNTLPLTPLKASITWTDVPGTANSGVLNDPTPALVNDLDIRITQGNDIFYPWKLQANASLPALRNADNTVDTVELVQIDAPNSGPYTITVNHKGTLVNDTQRFSLVITGITNSFALLNDGETEKTVCSNETAAFDFNFISQQSSPVTFSAEQVPNGASVSFSSSALISTGTFEMVISDLEGLAGGTYPIHVVASNGSETQTRTVSLKVYQENLELVTTISPTPFQTGLGSSVNLVWESNENTENYFVELATDMLFQNVVFFDTTTSNQLNVFNLSEQSIYYWRVLPSNRCGVSMEVPFQSFQTGEFNCNLLFEATDYSNAIIEEVAGATAIVPINIPDDFAIGKVNVIVDISHTWVQDMTIFLQRDGGNLNSITLIEQPCGGQDDIDAVFDDNGTPFTCNNLPAISGTILPMEPLSSFNLQNAQGNWNLFITDNYFEDGGQVNLFALQFCSTAPITNVPSLQTDVIITETNSTKVINNQELNANTLLQLSSEQTFTVSTSTSLGILQKEGLTMDVGSQFTQQDIDQGLISYNNVLSEASIDFFTVDVVNNNGGWLPNQMIEIVIQNTLNTIEFGDTHFQIVPNPTSDVIFIKGIKNFDGMVTIFDLQGRKVNSKLIRDQEPISLIGLQDGMYVIQVSDGDILKTEKIILKKN
ncbi:MAG: S8 family serine peptidase [Flavobacterium sp.]